MKIEINVSNKIAQILDLIIEMGISIDIESFIITSLNEEIQYFHNRLKENSKYLEIINSKTDTKKTLELCEKYD